jgi:energy-coupling factor transport system ATP-binding protein
VAIVGANGSGKTTLARHINALLLPTSGRVWIDGRDTQDASATRAIRSTVGMVFQSPSDQIVATVVQEDVAFGPENLGVPEDELGERVRASLQRVSMWHARQRPPHMLSAGQQQRVAIAGVLAMRPRCIVFDEASAMLDPVGRRDVLAVMDVLHRNGMTVLTITHSMQDAARAQRVVVMHEGQIVLDGAPSQVFSSERLSEYGLVVPPTVALARRLRPHLPQLAVDPLTPSALADALAEAATQSTHIPPAQSQLDRGRPARQLDSGSDRRHLARPVVAEPVHERPARPPQNQTERLIHIQDLHHTYLAGTPLAQASLHGVDITVYRGQVVALVGATGSGKSTLLQHMNGLLRPQVGQAWVDGHDVRDPATDLRQIRRTVGLVFQRPENQLFEHYVGDDVAYGARLAGLRGPELRERVRWAMEWVGLGFELYKDRLTFSLSGGERRRAGLAGVLVLRPRVLLLDEPTAGLDPMARAELLSRLQNLHADGATMVIATHNMDDVALLADWMVVLERGRVAMQGPPRQVFARADRLTALGLDVPSVTGIVSALVTRGLTLPGDVLTLDEAEGAVLPLFADQMEDQA